MNTLRQFASGCCDESFGCRDESSDGYVQDLFCKRINTLSHLIAHKTARNLQQQIFGIYDSSSHTPGYYSLLATSHIQVMKNVSHQNIHKNVLFEHTVYYEHLTHTKVIFSHSPKIPLVP